VQMRFAGGMHAERRTAGHMHAAPTDIAMPTSGKPFRAVSGSNGRYARVPFFPTVPMLTALVGLTLGAAPAPHPRSPEGVAQSATAAPDTRAATYNGRGGQLTVRIPRVDTHIDIDGSLSAPVWQQAAVLTGFSEYQPVDGVPAEDSTEVLVWYSPTAIYFGIRAYELHGAPHATLANRDRIDGDDNVQLVISPFVHSHQALVFAVNPFGIQEDGTITEGVQTSRGFGVSNKTGPDSTDLSPDFVYESKGTPTAFGYQVEVRIPFRSIKFPAKSPQDWGINIVRRIQHSGHLDTWYPTRLAASSYLDQAGTLAGLTKLDAGLVLDLNPIVTEKALGSRVVSPGPGWQYGVERPQFGGNVRWGITNNLLLNGTYRPDFAEVESDATQLILDPRQAVLYPEKRPFFLDGLEQFNTPANLIYTRQIEAPIAASKLTGKLGDVSLAYLGAIDNQGSAALGGGHPAFNILRLRQDFAQGSQIGAAFTDKEEGGSFNRLASVDSRITFAKLYTLTFQAAGSSTRRGGVSTAGPLWSAGLTRAGRSFIMSYGLSGIDPEFAAGSGFISRAGVANGSVDWRYTFYPKHTFLDTFGIDLLVNDTWVYRDLTAGHAPEDRRYHITWLSTLHGGWQLLFGLYAETYGYDPTLYANYYLGHPSGTGTTFTHFVGTPIIPNTDYVLQVSTPAFSKFDLSLLELSGRDENFFEWSSADISVTEATLNYRPTDKLRLQLMYNAQIYWRHDDYSIAAKTLIPRLGVEYQLSRPIFFRIIGQYDATYQNNLRDDARTGLPIYFFDPASGTYARAAAFQSNRFQLTGLFSYQPIPGTVAFVGYGNNLAEPDGFHFNPLHRVADNFFVKFSYLFRMQ